MAQRRAANIRERRRMLSLNEAFDRLRRKVGSSGAGVDCVSRVLRPEDRYVL